MTTERIDIPWTTLFRLAGFAIIVAAAIHLAPLLLLILTSLLIAIALDPALSWLDRFMPRALAAAIVILIFVSLIVSFMIWIGPPLWAQFSRVLEKAPMAGQSLMSHLPPRGLLHKVGEKFVLMPALNVDAIAPHILNYGQRALGIFTSLILMIALVSYLLVDGRGALSWLFAFFPAPIQEKLRSTADQVTPVVSAYIVGQFITSLLCSIFVYILLKGFGVPAALLLAVIAGVCDILPIIGFFLSAVPAILFALTVSTNAALWVAVLYAFYHVLENYLIVPVVYGNRLRVSGLVVLISILAGAGLAGIVGAIVILPVVASYPIIERIWLAKYIGRRAVAEHKRQDAGPAPASTAKPVAST